MISPLVTEKPARDITPENSRTQEKKHPRVDIFFDTPSLAVESNQKKRLPRKSVYCRLPCMLAAAPRTVIDPTELPLCQLSKKETKSIDVFWASFQMAYYVCLPDRVMALFVCVCNAGW